MTLSRWEPLLKRWFGLSIPDDYLTFDIETTGFNKKFDLPIDFGWTIVRGRKPVSRGNFVLDWTRVPEVESGWLVDQLDRIDQQFALAGNRWVYTWDYLHDQGKDPFWVLAFALKLFRVNREQGAMFVGHNAVNFDEGMLQHNFAECLGEAWEFHHNELIDTGAWEKILCCFPHPSCNIQLTPRAGETMKEFLRRAAYSRRPGVRWRITDCVDKYDLCRRYQLCKEDLHGAQMDSYACHLLTEFNREGS